MISLTAFAIPESAARASALITKVKKTTSDSLLYLLPASPLSMIIDVLRLVLQAAN